VGPAPKGKGRFVGGDLQGEPTKQSHAVPQGARALTPKQSPIEEDRKAGRGTARTELQIRFQRLDGSKRANVSAAVGNVRSKGSGRVPCEFRHLVGRRIGGGDRWRRDGSLKRGGFHEARWA